jgi:hypothetical protein
MSLSLEFLCGFGGVLDGGLEKEGFLLGWVDYDYSSKGDS